MIYADYFFMVLRIFIKIIHLLLIPLLLLEAEDDGLVYAGFATYSATFAPAFFVFLQVIKIF